MKICNNLREFLELLEEMGELITINEEVGPHNFELSSLIRHSEAGPNKAVYFPQVKSYSIPVVGNLFGSLRRCYLACGIEPKTEEVERYRGDPRGSPGGLGGMAGMLMNAFTLNEVDRVGTILLRDKILWAEEEAASGRARAKILPTGPCKEVKITKDFDLPAFLPVPWHCEGDVGPYINPAGLVQRDPDTGLLNIGVRRHQVTYQPYGKDRMGVLIVEATDGYKIWKKYEEKNQPCPVALCIGLDPVTEIMANYSSAHFSVPNPSYSEFDSASAILGRPLEMVRCETVDLEVPANTEIVIEGFMPPHERLPEGPMAEFTDMYAMKGALPYIQVTAITHRKSPIFHTCMSGRSQEHVTLGVVTGWGREESIRAKLKEAFPSVRDVAMFAGSYVFHVVVSMKKHYEGEDKLLLFYLLSQTPYKYITIVDEDIDPHNSEQVEWARCMRAGASAEDFLVFPKTHCRELDPEKDENTLVTRLGILATLPYGKKYIPTGPPQEMLDKTRALFEKSQAGG